MHMHIIMHMHIRVIMLANVRLIGLTPFFHHVGRIIFPVNRYVNTAEKVHGKIG